MQYSRHVVKPVKKSQTAVLRWAGSFLQFDDGELQTP